MGHETSINGDGLSIEDKATVTVLERLRKGNGIRQPIEIEEAEVRETVRNFLAGATNTQMVDIFVEKDLFDRHRPARATQQNGLQPQFTVTAAPEARLPQPARQRSIPIFSGLGNGLRKLSGVVKIRRR